MLFQCSDPLSLHNPVRVVRSFIKIYIQYHLARQSRTVIYDTTGAGHAGPSLALRLVGWVHLCTCTIATANNKSMTNAAGSACNCDHVFNAKQTANKHRNSWNNLKTEIWGIATPYYFVL